jgi:hypothetical protein
LDKHFSLGTVAALGIMTFLHTFRHKLIIALFSPDLAASKAADFRRLVLLYCGNTRTVKAVFLIADASWPTFPRFRAARPLPE